MARKYEKVKVLLPAVQQLQAEGKTRKEIAKELGLQSEKNGKRSALPCTTQAGKDHSQTAREKACQDIGGVQI